MSSSKKGFTKNVRFTYKALNISLPRPSFQSLPRTDRTIYHKVNSSQTAAPSDVTIALGCPLKTNSTSRFLISRLCSRRNECVGTDVGVSAKGKLLVWTLKKESNFEIRSQKAQVTVASLARTVLSSFDLFCCNFVSLKLAQCRKVRRIEHFGV